MCTLPLNTIEPKSPLSFSFKRGLLLASILFAAGILVYSGTAWLWLRPALHKPLINKYAGQYKFDPLWVMAIIRVESRFAASAHSPRGAVGLMQLLPRTARELAPEIGLRHFQDDDLKDPEVNIHLGFHYLAKLKRW